jgi:ribose/xylose/arabinose/galactoside ABC-type transport system permease subunit
MRSERVLRFFGTEGATVGVLLVAAVLLFSALNSVYLTSENIENILVQSTFVLLIAVGMTFVLITGGIDLSVGSVLGLSAGISVLVLVKGGGFIAALAAPLAVGLGVGLLNGVLITKLQISDFIVTLATLGMAGGALVLIAGAQPLNGFDSPAFTALSNDKLLGIPLAVIIAAVIVIVLELVLRRTGFGRAVFAVGINREAAHLSGIAVDRVRIAVFVTSGVLAAASGILLASRLSSVPPRLGQGFELQAIAAAALAGTSLAGGRGSVARAALGALFLGAVNVGLQIQEIDSAWFQVVVGLSIVGAMVLDRAVRDLALSRLRARVHTPGLEGA